MITASQKMIAVEEEQEKTISQSDILSVLDSEGIAPERFLSDNDNGKDKDEEKEKEKDFSSSFIELKNTSQQ